MVDALRESRRTLRGRGVLVDARPDSRVLARVEHAGRVVATVRTHAEELANDVASDRAVARVKREGLFRRVRAGRFWHRLDFADRAALDVYLAEHMRFHHRADWRGAAAARRSWRADAFVVVRPIRYEVLERGSPRDARPPRWIASRT